LKGLYGQPRDKFACDIGHAEWAVIEDRVARLQSIQEAIARPWRPDAGRELSTGPPVVACEQRIKAFEFVSRAQLKYSA
jgi:hypothetical protein